MSSPPGEDGHGDSVAGQRCAVCRAVDAVGATGDHRDVALNQPGRQISGHLLAICGRSPGSDQSRRTLRHLVEACRDPAPTTPSAARRQRLALRAYRTRRSASIGHSSSSGVISRPPRRASSSRSCCGPVYFAPGLGMPRQIVIDLAAPDPVGRLAPGRRGAPGRQVPRRAVRPPGTGKPMPASSHRSSRGSRLPEAERGGNFVGPGRRRPAKSASSTRPAMCDPGRGC